MNRIERLDASDFKEEIEEVWLLLEYLKVLQEGKQRPDRNGNGSVRDAIDNLDDIEGVKDLLNNKFGISQVDRSKKQK